ncbi:hypothetical protein ABT354_12510 [Streptomyces sp. NPDC000594]|uniref:hypothetical protein n=1 Tax=Streptomyces sp. NPDC000594 TaxID=3154261 RepID=UPI003318AF10
MIQRARSATPMAAVTAAGLALALLPADTATAGTTAPPVRSAATNVLLATVYQHERYQGGAFEIWGASCPSGGSMLPVNELPAGFNDAISSIRLARDCYMIVYEHTHRRGGNIMLAGHFATLPPAWNDQISSLGLLRPGR